MKNILKLALIALIFPALGLAQSNNVQTAWRAYEDYKTTVQEGKPDVSYLMKAKEKIDLAREHADTKDKPKTQAYVCKIYYALFQYNWEQEKKKLSATITNKTQLAEEAYGNVPTKEFEVAGEAMQKVMESEAKQSEKPYTMELIPFAMNMFSDMQNLAVGRFKVKKYDEAMEIFNDTYTGYKMAGKKDTSLIYNALISAEKAKKYDKVIEFGKVMSDDKVITADVYNKIHFAHLEKKDTANAEKTLKEGIEAFPNDKGLILNYINIFLQQKKEAMAVDYINKAIEKDPKNCALYMVMGNIYDNQANPKSPKTGKDTTKPGNFNDLMTKAESFYLKAISCNPEAYDSNFNLGAVYNNWGNWYSQNAPADSKGAAEADKKAKEYWGKAVQYLEKCNTLKPDDKGVMRALVRLYRMTDQADKASAMNEKLKK